MSSSTSNDKNPISTILLFHKALLEWSHIIRNIVDGLCQRDSRFQFIRESIHEFEMGDEKAGLIFGLRGLINLIPELRPPGSPPRGVQSPEETWRCHKKATGSLNYIVCALIFEILDAFGINISINQAPERFNIKDHIELVQDLYKRSKNLLLVPAGSTSPKELLNNNQERYSYQYSDNLALLSKGFKGKIRVLHLAPGAGKGCIECHLEVRDIYTDQIDEALSYVWGQRRKGKAIWIDGDLFQVNENLHDILVSLRHTHTTRTLWVDAICINQLDLKEKAHQVRHMGEIYSRDKRTTIWLSGQTPDLLPTNDPYDIFAPLPSNIGGCQADQYDLVGILAKVHVAALEIPWNKEQLTLGIMLTHCINKIMSDEWWERVWTIQEAVLPQKHPHFIFQGFEFTFGDFVQAIKSIQRFISHMPKELLNNTELQDSSMSEENDAKFLRKAFLSQVYYWYTVNRSHLLPYLRPGLEFQDLSTPLHREIHFLLCQTSYYKSTDPRDKYFALQALLPKSKARLMYVDYTKSKETIFRHATAWCYNTSEHLGMTTTFKLLIESEPAGCGPSWVHDFSYSDARFHDHCRRVTFSGYLHTENNWQPGYGYGNAEKTMCFATPSTLSCSGLSIDVVRVAGIVPNLRDDGYSLERLCTFLKDVQVSQNQEEWEEHRDDGIGFSKDRMSIIESMCTKLYDAAMGHPERIDELRATFDGSPPDQQSLQAIYLEQGRKNLDLFTLGGGISMETAYTATEIRRRAEDISGMQYFLTNKKLLGIATAPVTEGDILAVIHATPAYFILREVKGSDGHSYVVQRHRMVARAVVSEKKDNMKRMMADLETRIFEIV
ncbi:heterokaryon incompatibility protein-domain-containing protein [Xylaria cubensis]|nr:heterokaryon incompatibility protein-domain-containing protein [Xylaria cubensis]